MKSTINFFRRKLRPYLTESGKQNQTIFYASFLFLLILGTFGVKPVLFETLKSYEVVKQGRQIEKRITRKIENINKAVFNTNKIRADFALIDESLPDSKDLPALLESLNLIFGSNNVTITEVQFNSLRPSKNPKVFILPLKVKASGSYENVLLVLEKIEKNPRQLDPVRLFLDIPQKGDQGFLDVSIDLETYFLKKIFT